MTEDLTIAYDSREAIASVSDADLERDFLVALSYPENHRVSLYVVTWMITDMMERGITEPDETVAAESSPAW